MFNAFSQRSIPPFPSHFPLIFFFSPFSLFCFLFPLPFLVHFPLPARLSVPSMRAHRFKAAANETEKGREQGRNGAGRNSRAGQRGRGGMGRGWRGSGQLKQMQSRSRSEWREERNAQKKQIGELERKGGGKRTGRDGGGAVAQWQRRGKGEGGEHKKKKKKKVGKSRVKSESTARCLARHPFRFPWVLPPLPRSCRLGTSAPCQVRSRRRLR